MSLVAQPFAVDITKVKNVFGSKDRELFEKIKTASAGDRYQHTMTKIQLLAYRHDFEQALEDIIFNYIKPEDRTESDFSGPEKSKSNSGLNENMAYIYGKVLLAICNYLGTHLQPGCDTFSYGEDFDTIAGILKEKGLKLSLEDMFNQHDVFDIPKTYEFPCVKLFTKDEIEHINEVMDNVEIDESKIDFESEDFDEIYLLLHNIRICFRTCREQHVEMLTFVH